MPRGNLSPWDAFWVVVDRLGKPARTMGGKLWQGLGVLLSGLALLTVGFLFMLWDVLQPFLRLAVLAFLVAVVLEGSGVIDLSSFIHEDPAPVSHGEGEAGPDTPGEGFGPGALMLAALGGALALMAAAGGLVAVRDRLDRRKRQKAGAETAANVTPFRRHRSKGEG